MLDIISWILLILTVVFLYKILNVLKSIEEKLKRLDHNVDLVCYYKYGDYYDNPEM